MNVTDRQMTDRRTGDELERSLKIVQRPRKIRRRF